MVNFSTTPAIEKQRNLVFHSLADPTRREILMRLSVQNLTIMEIAKGYNMSLPAISKHLKILERAKLVSREKKGREYTMQIEPKALRYVAEYLEYYRKFWASKLDNLENFFKKGGKNSNEK